GSRAAQRSAYKSEIFAGCLFFRRFCEGWALINLLRHRLIKSMFTRRRALKSIFLAGSAAALTGLYTWRWEPHWLEFTYPALPVPGLPAALVGHTIAHITDTHIGPEVDDGYVIESFL